MASAPSAELSILHPILNRRCPTIQQLRSRTDPHSLRLIDTAIRLALWRIDLGQQIEKLLSARAMHPWPEPSRAPNESPSLMPVDLLRALIANEVETIGEIVPTPNGLLHESSTHWKAVANESPEGPPPPLDIAWARRFALADLQHGTPTLDVPYLIASLGYETIKLLMPLSRLLDEDLASEREVAKRCVENARRLCQDRLFEPVLPAYFDRHGGIAALDQALQQHHGVLIVGQEKTDRTSLMEAWIRRLVLGPTPAGYEGVTVYQNPFDAPWVDDATQLEKVIAGQPSLVALTPKGCRVFYDPREEDPLHTEAGFPERLWGYEPEYPAAAVETRLIARCAEWASEPWKRVYLILVVTPAERERLVSRVPLVAEFPAIEVPAFNAHDHLPIWLCYTMDHPELGLEQALAVMSEVRPADVLAMKPWDLRPVLGSNLAQRLWDPTRIKNLDPPGWLLRAMQRIRQGRDPWQREMLGAKGRFVERFIGDDHRFAALVQLQASLRGENRPDGLSVFELDDCEMGPPTIDPYHELSRSKDMPLGVHFVYCNHQEGPSGKRVRRIRGRTVLQWFQLAWHEAIQAESPEPWIAETLGGPVPGLPNLFQDVLDEGLNPPETWKELHELLWDHLYIPGGPDDIRSSPHTLRVKTTDDDVDASFYLFDEAYGKVHPDRCSYLLNKEWPLPTSSSEGPFASPSLPNSFVPKGEKGTTYVCLFSSLDMAGSNQSRSLVFHGVRLSGVCDYLRGTMPSTAEIDAGSAGEPWPFEVRLLRAMIEEGDETLAPALERCKHYPLTRVASSILGPRIGIGSIAQAREAFQEAAMETRLKRDPDRTRIVLADHITQVSLWADETFGYQLWYIFDDRWAAAHPDLACSLLRCASSWDPLL